LAEPFELVSASRIALAKMTTGIAAANSRTLSLIWSCEAEGVVLEFVEVRLMAISWTLRM
jgi:hypothetical protein